MRAVKFLELIRIGASTPYAKIEKKSARYSLEK
jgi:hypothetical protein